MPVNWGQANEGQFDYLQSLQAIGNSQAQKLNTQRGQYAFDQQRTQDAARPQLFAQAQRGDFTGAQAGALAGNDLDAYKVIAGLDDNQRQQVKMHAQLIGGFAANLSTLPQGEARVAALRAAAPQLKAQGFTDEELAQADLSDNGLRGYIAAAGATDNALEAYYKSQQPITLADGSQEFGATPMGGGARPLIAENAKDPPRADYVLSADGANWLLKPGTGGAPMGGAVMPSGVPGGGGQPSSGPISVDSLKPLFSAQESGGKYTARNAETGAMGRWQVMPDTGRALAKKLGVEWRPDMMLHDTPEDRAYQDKIGEAAIAEAVAKSGGDPSKAFGYYYSGTLNESKWGPKTKQYIADMSARLGGGGPRSAPAGTPGMIPTGQAPKVKEKDAPSGYEWTPDGKSLRYVKGGPADPAVASNRSLKPPPQQIVTKVIENRNAIRNIDGAFRELDKYPNGVGLGTGGFGLWDPNRTDPKGTEVRSAIANIGSLLVHDRSGAAVTISETPRLYPFVPQVTDSPQTARKKMTRLRAEIASINEDFETEYSPDNGFRPIAPSRSAAPQGAPRAQQPKGKGAKFLGFE